MMRKGGGGRIVNVAARIVEQPGAGMTAYVIAKAGVAALTRALAEEVRGDGILVNAILPSIIDTPANRAAMPKAPVERWPKPDEIAQSDPLARFARQPTHLWSTDPGVRRTHSEPRSPLRRIRTSFRLQRGPELGSGQRLPSLVRNAYYPYIHTVLIP